MKIHVEPLTLTLENPFKLSYGVSHARHNVLVTLDDGQHIGRGEAAVVPYYGETPERIMAEIGRPAVQAVLDQHGEFLTDALDNLPPFESMAAHAALDMALHDLHAQRLGMPLYQLWGHNPARIPQSSFTVAMPDDPQDYEKRLAVARDYPLLKLKLGSGDAAHDVQLVERVRQITNQQICVDANGGWSAAEGLQVIPQLAALGVLFIEQPVARDDLAGWQTLRRELPPNMPPLIADESVQGVASVAALRGIVDGINIKLAKCGGLRAAQQMIALARVFEMRVLMGCMVESSLAVTAAAQLAPLADFADLDGHLLVTDDPFEGVQVSRGKVRLPTRPGLGVRQKDWE